MDELAKKMAELAERFGPNVIDAARGAAVTEAYSSMAGGAMCFAAAVGLALVGRWFFSKQDPDEDLDGWRVLAIVVWAVAGCLLIPAVWAFIDPWVWTTINHPDLWIAKKILHL